MGKLTKVLSREAILAAEDVKVERVEVPQWGGYVLVRGMTGIERDSFEESVVEVTETGRGRNAKRTARAKMDNIRAKLVARCVVDEAGNRVFADADIEALGRKSAAALDRIFDIAQRLSGITAEDIDELAKNSGTGQSGEPGSH